MLMGVALFALCRYQYFHRVYRHVLSPIQSQLLEHYLTSREVRPATVRSFRSAMGTWIAFAGDIPADTVTPALGSLYRQAVLARARPETWNSYLAHLRSVYKRALLDNVISSNPFAAVALAPVTKKPKQTVSPNVLDAAMAKLHQSEIQTLRPQWFWRVAVQALYYTGMRRHQLIALRWRDIDFTARTLLLATDTRSTRREWFVPLNAKWTESLLDLRRRTIELLGRSDIDDDQVFNVTRFYSRYKGTEMTDEHITGFFTRLSAAIGHQITPHQLRNTAATDLMRSTNNNVASVQGVLGHKKIEQTFEYVENDLEALAELIDKMPFIGQ